MSSDAKLGLVAGVLAVLGVAMFGMPKNEKPMAPVPAKVEVTPPPAANLKPPQP